MIIPDIYLADSPGRGRGVFTDVSLEAGITVEVAPVIVLSAADRLLLDRTLLHDYIFEWGPERRECCMALGHVPIYNHACPSNCEYEMDFEHRLIRIKTVRAIEKGEELFINYGGDHDNTEAVWFDAR